MPITTKRATSNEEFDQVFQLRHQVLVGDGYLRCRSDERVYDRFDAFPTTCVIVAQMEQQIIGTIRATIDSGLGTSVDEHYDFAQHCSPAHQRIAAGSHFYIAPAFRGQFQVATLLLEMFHFWCVRQGCQYVKGVMNPRTVSLMQRLGYVPIGAAQLSPKDQLPFVPVLLDLQRLSASLLAYTQRQPVWETAETFHRLHCEAEEIVPFEGESLYLIQGDVAALQSVIQPISSGTATVPLKYLFTQGDLITAEAAGRFCLQATSKVELAVITSAVLTAFSSRLWAASRI